MGILFSRLSSNASFVTSSVLRRTDDPARPKAALCNILISKSFQQLVNFSTLVAQQPKLVKAAIDKRVNGGCGWKDEESNDQARDRPF